MLDGAVTYHRCSNASTIALQLRKHGEASPFRWNAAKINEAADLCLQMAEELEQREDPEDERDTKLK